MLIDKRILLIFFLFITRITLASEEPKITKLDYIRQWKDEAIFQMVEHHIPASITLAQGMLESRYGNSTLARNANNHFGIKCHDWKGKKVYHDDDKRHECFRKYKNPSDSYEDHSQFLKQPRYQFLYDYKITNYKAWAKGLKKAGYATDPKYPRRLIDLIETYNLDQYDREGLKMMKAGKKPNRKNNKPQKYHRPKKKKNQPTEDIFVDDELPDVAISNARKINSSKNNIKYVVAKNGDTFESIALDLDLMPWQVWKYNDMQKTDNLTPGQIVYIQPKRNNGSKKWHTLKEGESLWDVAQRYGVKLKKLYKKNGWSSDFSPAVGTKISLKKNIAK